ncbi:hypothetical protein F4818DRAFT_86766 [Hypoxylon cercidicola]|nr:hypothetical protein F4818DRAFT_86766 [Hypoxylon cercidicola]
MANRSGWYEDAERTYYADEYGRPIVVKAKGYQYHSPDMNIPTYQEVVGGYYKPFSGAPSSYPPSSQPSSSTSRYTDRNTPYFGPGSEHSGRGHVDHPASKPSVCGYSRPGISTDVYRDKKAQFAAPGPSFSAYDQQYGRYKTLGDEDAEAGGLYVDWKRGTAREPTKEERRDHPELYGGRPLGTSEWHQEGARRASEAARASQAHADARQAYLEDYIGYHEHRYLHGHQTAIGMVRKREDKYEGEVKNHNDWHSVSDLFIPAGG